MDILSYLSALIQTRRTVGIAGLGTVLKIKTPGRFDAETHSFIPPNYTIDFTAEISEEESLAEYISKKRNVSIDTALYFINEFSAGLQQQLNEGKIIRLGDMGQLRKSAEGLEFTPSSEKTYGFDFFGLPSVKEEVEAPIQEIISETPEVEDPAPVISEATAAADVPSTEEIADRDQEPEQPATIPEEEPTIASVMADNEQLEENPGDDAEKLQEEIDSLNFYRSKLPYLKESGPVDEEVILRLKDPEVDLPRVKPLAENRFFEPSVPYTPLPMAEHKAFPNYLKVILVTIIILLMLSALYLFKPEWFSGMIGKGNAGAVNNNSNSTLPAGPATLPDTARLTDSTDKATPAAVPAKSDSLEGITNGIAISTENPADTTTVYEVIGASMHDQKEADGFIAQMKKSGIKAKVVTNMAGKRLKISIATLKDENTANLERERLAQKLKIPGMYIYRNKQQ